MVSEIAFVEAYPFASRLHVLAALAVGAAQSGAAVTIYMPPRPTGEDYTAFLEQVSSQDIAIKHVGATTNRETRVQSKAVERLLSSALEGCSPKNLLIVLTAIDDYPRALAKLALMVRISRSQSLFVRYRIDDLSAVSSRRNLRQLAKRVHVAACELIAGARVAVFDERVSRRRRRIIIPDPWSGPFGRTTKTQARRALQITENDQLVALVGNQDRRKGFREAVSILVTAAATIPYLSVVLIGRVPEEYASDLGKLLAALGPRFTHITSYITDEELATRLAASDVVLLPYDKTFTSTSGVLVRAAASGTPVLSTNHGLIGWRVVKHGLGKTYPAGEVETAVTELRSLVVGTGLTVSPTFATESTFDAVAKSFASQL